MITNVAESFTTFETTKLYERLAMIIPLIKRDYATISDDRFYSS